MNCKRSSILVLFGLIFFFACSEHPDVVGPITEGETGQLEKRGSGFAIAPSGDLTGETDWNNIMNAFQQAMAAGPGHTVILKSGRFYIDKPVMVSGFNGTFAGAGKNATIIEPTRGPNDEGFGTVYIDAWDNLGFPGSKQYGTPLLYFPDPEGYVRISDMTLQVTALNIAQDWGVYDGNGNLVIGPDNDIMEGITIFLGSDCNTSIERVKLVGIPRSVPNDYHYASPEVGFRVAGRMEWEGYMPASAVWPGGTHVLKGCEFSTVGTASYLTAGLGYANILVGGGRFEKNQFADGYMGVCPWGLNGCNVIIRYNEFDNMHWENICLSNTPYDAPHGALSRILITHNNLSNVSDDVSGIFLEDDWEAFEGESRTLKIMVMNNQIQLASNTPDYGGIGIFSIGLRDAMLANNTMTGSGYAGIYSIFTEESKFALNDVQNVQAANAPIYLGYETNNCIVIGTDLNTSVMDWSDDPATPQYDGNNTLIDISNIIAYKNQSGVKQRMIQKFRSRGQEALAKRLEVELNQ